MSPTDDQILVIGAGPAGLAAASALLRAGLAVTVLERGPAVGSSWRTRHEDLRLNTVRQFSGLPGLPIPRRFGRWVGRDDYISYLEGVAVAEHICVVTGVEATRIERRGEVWAVLASDGVHRAEHVIVATGHDRIPVVPAWPGAADFAGEIRHVGSILAPRAYAGRDVLVAGGGNSGIEWAEHLARVGAGRIWLSVRTPPNLLPREVVGLPLHPLSVGLRGLPIALKDANARVVRRLTLGDLSRHGLPTPAEGPFRHIARTGVTVAVDSGFSRLVRTGRVLVVPEIAAFEHDGARLVDGTVLAPSVVLAATGYRSGLVDLVGDLGVLDEHGRPHAAPDDIDRGLWFIGFTAAIEGMLRLHGIEARRIARAIGRAGVVPDG